MTFPDSLDLAAELEAQPIDGGLIIGIERAISFGDPKRSEYGLRISAERKTKSGRAGKPRQIMFLVGDEDDSVGDLLRRLGDVFDVGEIEVTK